MLTTDHENQNFRKYFMFSQTLCSPLGSRGSLPSLDYNAPGLLVGWNQFIRAEKNLPKPPSTWKIANKHLRKTVKSPSNIILGKPNSDDREVSFFNIVKNTNLHFWVYIIVNLIFFSILDWKVAQNIYLLFA